MRYPDWIQRLEQYLRACSTPFHYGRWDCFLFVSGAVQAMAGIDPAEPYRGHYRSRQQARALLKQEGGYGRVFQSSGLAEIPVRQAQRGDVLQVSRFGLGLLALDGQRAYTVSDGGVVLIVPQLTGKAWRV